MPKSARIAIALLLAAVFAVAIVWKERSSGGPAPEAATEAPTEVPTGVPTGVSTGVSTEGAADAVPQAQPDPLPRLVDLGSNKCVPCKMMAPILESLAEEYPDAFEVEVIDVRQDPLAAQLYEVRVIPTQIFFDADGEEQFRHEGFMAKDAILETWRELGVEIPPRSADEARE